MSAQVAFLLGSDSDFPAVEKGIALLRRLQVDVEVEVSSAHRTPERTLEIVRACEKSGVQVIVAAAGGAAHLPGVVAGHTLLPVLGVPMASALSGLDSLLAMVQMPAGVPVAVFGIGESGAVNAALFAAEMLAGGDPGLRERLQSYRAEQRQAVLAKDRRLKERLAKE
ncbi:MAG: 5-(carboxyamino)imidazole ribonucleotide mutase [Candidatus Aminicenantes bacterium]|nr:5-(carboxyamino)imidazole ribonucleotide mutase [Candidatus Aminicenantes bacterium]